MKLNSEAYFQAIKTSPGPRLTTEDSMLGSSAHRRRRPSAGELTPGLSPGGLWLGIRVSSQEGARGLSLTTLFHLPRSERQLPLPQPQGGGVEQPGP